MTRLPIGTPSQERFAQLYKYKILWEATNIGVVNLTFYSALTMHHYLYTNNRVCCLSCAIKYKKAVFSFLFSPEF